MKRHHQHHRPGSHEHGRDQRPARPPVPDRHRATEHHADDERHGRARGFRLPAPSRRPSRRPTAARAAQYAAGRATAASRVTTHHGLSPNSRSRVGRGVGPTKMLGVAAVTAPILGVRRGDLHRRHADGAAAATCARSRDPAPARVQSRPASRSIVARPAALPETRTGPADAGPVRRSRRPHGRRGSLLVATLVTRLAKKLAVLLLGHPLAALLDDGAHGVLTSLPMEARRRAVLVVDRRVEEIECNRVDHARTKSEALPYAIAGPPSDASGRSGRSWSRSCSRASTAGDVAR